MRYSGLVLLCLGCAAEPEGWQADKSMAWVMAQNFVEQNLKSPGTADYGWQSYEETVTVLSERKYRVRGWVDSQNSFGAVLRSNFVVDLEESADGETWTLSAPVQIE